MAEPAAILPPPLRDLAALIGLREDPASRRERNASEWDALIALARRHRVEALLAANVSERGVPIGANHARELAKLRLQQHRRNLRTQAALPEAAEALAAENIPFLLLKGPSIGERYYDEPLDRRAMDLDLLVRVEDLRAVTLLQGLGFASAGDAASIPGEPPEVYRRVSADHPLWRERDRTTLELHWRLSRNSRFPPWDAPFLFAHADPLRIERMELEMQVLRPPVLLVYLLCHGARHLWFRIKWLADIDRMLARLSEAECAEAARLADEAGCARAFHTGLALCAMLFGSALPEVHDPARVHRGLIRAMCAAMAEDGIPGEEDLASTWRGVRARLQLHTGIAYRAELLRHYLIAPEDIARLSSAKIPFPLLVAAGPLLSLRRVLRRFS